MAELRIEEAMDLVVQAMLRAGAGAPDARIIAEHLIDCELRGLAYGGLSRALTVAERLAHPAASRRPLQIMEKSPVSALVDGGGQPGYVAAYRATQLALEKAKAHGIGIAGLFDTWLTGMLSYYMEMLTRAGLVGIAFASGAWKVAPPETAAPRFGANPVAFGFPTGGDPVIFDAGMSVIPVSEAVRRERLGIALPPGAGYDAEGRPSTDASRVLEGAFAAWGGHRGAGLGMAVQLLGLLCGGEVPPPAEREQCQLILALSPDLLVGAEAFMAKATAYAASVRPARLPFERSLAARRAALARGTIDVADEVLAALRARTG